MVAENQKRKVWIIYLEHDSDCIQAAFLDKEMAEITLKLMNKNYDMSTQSEYKLTEIDLY